MAAGGRGTPQLPVSHPPFLPLLPWLLAAPSAKGRRKQSEGSDSSQLPASPKPTGQQSGSQSPGLREGSREEEEREAERAFLVSLYEFMKERRTPIERVPHLGFKQINLWKIHQAVERRGAYELVTGRRLWKHVYDELGGSPGSTSAATCTRRHYERLVLPYVRHLKGEDDKPLPPCQPRRPHKTAQDPARPKRAREERPGARMIPGEAHADAADLARLPGPGPPEDGTRRPGAAPGPPSPRGGARPRPPPAPPAAPRGVLSPLAKKKLLAQAHPGAVLRPVGRHPGEPRCPTGGGPARPSRDDDGGLSAPQPRLGWGGAASRPSAFRRSGPGPPPSAGWASPRPAGPDGLPPRPPPAPRGREPPRAASPRREEAAGRGASCPRGPEAYGGAALPGPLSLPGAPDPPAPAPPAWPAPPVTALAAPPFLHLHTRL
ncbi:AT-rich interactive domain-containing protein 5A [Perognathus longimembris pacificus]|uniref:AT-rich interactive domain-containing protein 5A n=1 Tax=Perognathus longimembris pacificus TaxID=214514 RepID=UPI002019DC6B|nr:AT-rich interactive domain-containing protein 5A [Perognathus longimembris pacificus]